jgi:hypothetical protein
MEFQCLDIRSVVTTFNFYLAYIYGGVDHTCGRSPLYHPIFVLDVFYSVKVRYVCLESNHLITNTSHFTLWIHYMLDIIFCIELIL